MATDYVLFIHGVDVRDRCYADPLIKLIEKNISGRDLKQIPIYWGDLNDGREGQLLTDWRDSRVWRKLWFKNLREGFILHFAGDVALYLSRYVGGEIANRIWDAVKPELSNPQQGDRLHFVTHSLGTVILFDLLFSARWDGPPDIPGHGSVMALREAIYGISRQAPKRDQELLPGQPPALESSNPNLSSPDLSSGIELHSITTMGSPMGIFSLIDVGKNMEEVKDKGTGAPLATHDITPRLQIMLHYLVNRVREKSPGWTLPWRNYLHPGDPIGSPLQILVPRLLGDQGPYLNVQDVPAPSNLWELLKERPPTNLFDFFAKLVGWNTISVLDGGNAHNSYWTSHKVAKGIAELIQQLADSKGPIPLPSEPE